MALSPELTLTKGFEEVSYAQLRNNGLSEDFFFAKFAQGFAFQSHSGDHGFFRFSFNSLSLDAFATHALRQKPSLSTRGKVAAGDVAVVLGPSAPDRVAAKHHGVFAASEQIALWRTMLNSSQK